MIDGLLSRNDASDKAGVGKLEKSHGGRCYRICDFCGLAAHHRGTLLSESTYVRAMRCNAMRDIEMAAPCGTVVWCGSPVAVLPKGGTASVEAMLPERERVAWEAAGKPRSNYLTGL